jgi:predicted RNase H-like nuclease (RuvC/YqgF family)
MEYGKVKEDRDFHCKQHVELKKDMLGIVKQEYQVESLKREKEYLENEIKSYEERCLIYEKQIEEFALLAQKPLSIISNSSNNRDSDHYYAKVFSL